MKKTWFFLFFATVLLILTVAATGCGPSCEHEWAEATCAAPKTCTLCAATEGEALSHRGGAANCHEKAVCEVCGEEYGEFDPDKHTGDVVWRKLYETHHKAYSCCEAGVTSKEAHKKKDGVCSVCGFQPKLSMSSASADGGAEEVVFVLSVADNPGIIGMDLTLVYDDSVMTLKKATAGSAFADLEFSSPETFHTGCRFLFDGTEISDKDIRDGDVLTLTFSLSNKVSSGEEYSILFRADAYDRDLNALIFKIENGILTVN